MADYSSVAPPSSNAGGGMNDAFKDALQRARQVRKTCPVVWFRKYRPSRGRTGSFSSALSALAHGIATG